MRNRLGMVPDGRGDQMVEMRKRIPRQQNLPAPRQRARPDAVSLVVDFKPSPMRRFGMGQRMK